MKTRFRNRQKRDDETDEINETDENFEVFMPRNFSEIRYSESTT